MKSIVFLLITFILSSCAVFTRGEQPTDVKIANLHWYISAPDFKVESFKWNVIDTKDRLNTLCGADWTWSGNACTVRIIAGGQCIIFSTLTESEAEKHFTTGGDSVKIHERRHCGVGMPSAAGWSHRE